MSRSKYNRRTYLDMSSEELCSSIQRYENMSSEGGMGSGVVSTGHGGSHGVVQRHIRLAGLHEGPILVLVVEQPHDCVAKHLGVNVYKVLPVLEGDCVEDPDAPGREPH